MAASTSRYQIHQTPACCKIGKPGDVNGYLPNSVGVVIVDTDTKLGFFFYVEKKEYYIVSEIACQVGSTIWETEAAPVLLDEQGANLELLEFLLKEKLIPLAAEMALFSDPRMYSSAKGIV